MTNVSLTLYHDVYETENGDGFYPYLDQELAFKEIIVTFKLEDNIWKQVYESNVPLILGFDGDQGEKILKELNKLTNTNTNTNTVIYNRFDQIYPKLKLSK
jgi:hypothetical protein